MIEQTRVGSTEKEQKRKVRQLIKNGSVAVAGNQNLKIYGKLSCGSGKRMKPVNRVFFKSQKEAIRQGYRPCGHCMRKQYEQWKKTND